MSAHAEWALVCRLFSTGATVMKMRLTASEVAVLPALAKAVKPTSHNVSIVPCPYCGMNGGEVRRSPDGDLECCCAQCGAVPVDADDLEEQTLIRLNRDELRAALMQGNAELFEGGQNLRIHFVQALGAILLFGG